MSIGSESLSCSRDSGMQVLGLNVSTASMNCRIPLADSGPDISKSLWGVGGLVGLPLGAETSGAGHGVVCRDSAMGKMVWLSSGVVACNNGDGLGETSPCGLSIGLQGLFFTGVTGFSGSSTTKSL